MLSTQETDAGGLPQVQAQLGLQSVPATLRYSKTLPEEMLVYPEELLTSPSLNCGCSHCK